MQNKKNAKGAEIGSIPSGISQATTASSARIHKTKFVTLGYSALQCSARCFPVIWRNFTNDQHSRREITY